MLDLTDQLQSLRGSGRIINEIMNVYDEAADVYEQALIAMGQRPTATHSTVASTRIVTKLTPDLNFEADPSPDFPDAVADDQY